MNQKKHADKLRLAPARVVGILFVVLLLNACAVQRFADVSLPPLTDLPPVAEVPDADILQLSPEMEVFLERYVLPYQNPQTRFDMLMTAVTSGAILNFDYSETRTLTASKAFEARTGNCIAFANMMVALAREAGFSARYQEVRRMSEWSSRADTLLLVKHINVVVFSPGFSYVVDVSGIKFDRDVPRRLVSDAYAKALYYNNIGAEALLREDRARAWSYLSAAARLQSNATDPWINLGVLYKRNGQPGDAEAAYRSALKINSRDYSALNNLYELYLTEENLPAAARLSDKVDRYRRKNPYYLMKLGELAMQEGDFDHAIELMQQAIRKKDNDALLHFAMVKAQFLSGNLLAAENYLMQARDVAPASKAAYYSRPLDELVMESLSDPECSGPVSCPD